MVIDTSALIAILLEESDKQQMVDKLAVDMLRYLSAVSLTEASNVMTSRYGAAGLQKLDELIKSLAIRILAVDRDQAILAREAFGQYGKGRHKAGLNFGDCFAYALAKQTGEPLLFKGNDFSQTDLLPA